MRKGRRRSRKAVYKAADESTRAAVLLGLRQAGGRGMTLPELGCKKAGDVRHRAIRALVGEGEVLVFGDGREAVAVLASRAPTAEAVSRKIDARASMKRGHVISRDEIAAWCTAAEVFLLEGAVRSLVKARRLVALRRGDATLYTHAESFAPQKARLAQTGEDGDSAHDRKGSR